MDPIEIFELYAYVVQASGVNPDFSVVLTEIRPYVVQQARAKDAIFASEIRAYAIQDGGPLTGVAVNTTAMYLIATASGTEHLHQNNSQRAGIVNRRPGVAVADQVVVTIEPDFTSAALRSAINKQDPGLMHMATTVYTIEVP